MQLENLFVKSDKELNPNTDVNSKSTVGTLGEKTLHAYLKTELEPDITKHEIKIGAFYADIYNEKGITEIQTGSFSALCKKLAFFLENHVVTVVYPIAKTKRLVWINPETGEATKKRKSPKTGSVYDVFFELYKIRAFLTHPNFRLKILLTELTEYRNLNGWSRDKKKGSERFDRVPEGLAETVDIENMEDYKKLIPSPLPELFTVKDFKKASVLSLNTAQRALYALKHINIVAQKGKKGNAYLYEVI